MVVMEDVTEEERSAELYVSVHGGLDHTFLKRGGGGGVIPFSPFVGGYLVSTGGAPVVVTV